MRILLATPYDLTYPGGVTSHVFDLAHKFHEMEHEVTIAGPASDGSLPQNGYTHHLGGTMRFISPGDSGLVNLNPLIHHKVRDFLDGKRFDVFHLHEPFLGFIGPSFMRLGDGVKVGTFHTSREGPHLPYVLAWPIVLYWNRGLDGRIAVSESARQTINRYVRAHYEVVPNGVDFDRFAQPAAVPAHLDDGRPTVLFVGRIEARKGIPYLLEAFKTVKQRIPDSRLVIVGEGALRPEYAALADKLGIADVLFEGYVAPESLPGYYQRADVFASSSTVNESFGITLLEAMAAGAPAVATSINGSNTLGEHEVNGLIVPTKDPEAMAASIERLLQDRARGFDWEAIARRLLAYYEELGA